MVVSSGTRKDGHLFTLKDRESLYNKLLDHMESNKIYLNSKLKIKDLSDILDTNPTYLSQAINSQSKRSFFDFINMYRIEYAKKLLSNKDYSKYTIEAIAKESGFNSRSVFYTAFKKFSDSSPSDYLENTVIDLWARINSLLGFSYLNYWYLFRPLVYRFHEQLHLPESGIREII